MKWIIELYENLGEKLAELLGASKYPYDIACPEAIQDWNGIFLISFWVVMGVSAGIIALKYLLYLNLDDRFNKFMNWIYLWIFTLVIVYFVSHIIASINIDTIDYCYKYSFSDFSVQIFGITNLILTLGFYFVTTLIFWALVKVFPSISIHGYNYPV
jgi:hypothetical protein